MDKIRQPTREGENSDPIITDEPEQEVTPINTTEYLQVQDIKTGLKITLGTSKHSVEDLANISMWIKENWNQDKPKGDKERSYYG